MFNADALDALANALSYMQVEQRTASPASAARSQSDASRSTPVQQGQPTPLAALPEGPISLGARAASEAPVSWVRTQQGECVPVEHGPCGTPAGPCDLHEQGLTCDLCNGVRNCGIAAIGNGESISLICDRGRCEFRCASCKRKGCGRYVKSPNCPEYTWCIECATRLDLEPIDDVSTAVLILFRHARLIVAEECEKLTAYSIEIPDDEHSAQVHDVIDILCRYARTEDTS
jgi:hypothetical protein